MITIKLTELSLPPDKVGNDLQEPTPIDNLPDHMTSFTGFPGISNPLLGTINESHVTTFEAQIGQENMAKMVSLQLNFVGISIDA